MKTALITGVTGQDGSYLSELLIEKEYEVYGIIRRSSTFNDQRIRHLYIDPHKGPVKLKTRYGNLVDASNLNRLVEEIEPDEVYNLAAQSNVGISFKQPEYTASVDALGALRLLDAIKNSSKDVKFYQASTSELFGKAQETPQDENTPFHPRSPYAVAKLYAHWITINYRESYDLFASNGILFNHGSSRRGKRFVTRKISRAVARINAGLQDKIYLGNLEAKRDWGYAPEYVKAMWKILQHDDPDDFVVATGETHTVREFVEEAFGVVGCELTWSGEGTEEVGRDQEGNILVEIDPRYFRPAEAEILRGDPSKAKEELGWRSEVKFQDLAKKMVESDIKTLEEKGPIGLDYLG